MRTFGVLPERKVMGCACLAIHGYNFQSQALFFSTYLDTRDDGQLRTLYIRTIYIYIVLEGNAQTTLMSNLRRCLIWSNRTHASC